MHNLRLLCVYAIVNIWRDTKTVAMGFILIHYLFVLPVLFLYDSTMHTTAPTTILPVGVSSRKRRRRRRSVGKVVVRIYFYKSLL